MKTVTIAVVFLGLIMGSASAMSSVSPGSPVKGSGVRAEETRDLSSFEEVHLHISADVNITRGEAIVCTVSADDNLLPIVETEVSGKTLHIKARETYSSRSSTVITLEVPLITKVAINGSGDVTLAEVTRDRLRLEVSGSGDIEATGTVTELHIGVSGSGDIDAAGLQAQRVEVRISGSGDVRVDARESLRATISGSGDITYSGSPPEVDTRVSGSGDIRAR